MVHLFNRMAIPRFKLLLPNLSRSESPFSLSIKTCAYAEIFQATQLNNSSKQITSKRNKKKRNWFAEDKK